MAVIRKTRPLRGRRGDPFEKPLRDELLSIEGLEERAKALAARFTIDPNPRRRSRSVFRRFDDNARVLRDTYRSLAQEVHEGEFVTPAAEPRSLDWTIAMVNDARSGLSI